MDKRGRIRIALIAGGIVLAPLALFGVEILLAMQGPLDSFQNPSPAPKRFGTQGSPLVYVVLGDSTAAGQGAEYAQGIAVQTARHLALTHRITLINLAVSGATLADVRRDQCPKLAALHPDCVLLSAGANDTTHFTPGSQLRADFDAVAAAILAANPRVKIVMTAAPQMGSVPRFAQPLRWFAGTQTARVNAALAPVIAARHLTWAHIAARTGPIFARDPTLFSQDKFHPNARGYAVWVGVLNEAWDEALTPGPSPVPAHSSLRRGEYDLYLYLAPLSPMRNEWARERGRGEGLRDDF